MYEMLPGGPILITEYIQYKNYFQMFAHQSFHNVILQG